MKNEIPFKLRFAELWPNVGSDCQYCPSKSKLLGNCDLYLHGFYILLQLSADSSLPQMTAVRWRNNIKNSRIHRFLSSIFRFEWCEKAKARSTWEKRKLNLQNLQFPHDFVHSSGILMRISKVVFRHVRFEGFGVFVLRSL